MKLQVTQENLTKALTTVGRVATSRGTLPVLANVLIKTTDNRLSISATNLDIAITHHIGSKISQEGSVTIPARLTSDFVASLPSGVIDLQLEETKLHITTDKYESTINGTVADDFPVMPKISSGNTWEIASQSLKSALQQVLPAASSDEARPVLTGVYIHTYNQKLYIVATDSYRLAEKEIGSHKGEVDLLIPAASLQELLRLIGDQDATVFVTHDDQQVQFKLTDTELVTRLIDGKYPDYRKLIPKAFNHQATLSRQDFVNITKVSSLFARESAGSVTLQLDKEANEISIRSIASQLGENMAAAEADVTANGSITLNSRYILDALNCIGGKQVIFSFNGKLEPCTVKDPNNKDYLHVIMPLKS
ncbi:MAG: DNA polymerase III subunit beta [Patescibacteria group bacterium]